MPCREGVGRKTRMKHRHGCGEVFILQIEIVLPYLGGGELSFIHNGARGHGGNVEIVQFFNNRCVNAMSGVLTQDE